MVLFCGQELNYFPFSPRALTLFLHGARGVLSPLQRPTHLRYYGAEQKTEDSKRKISLQKIQFHRQGFKEGQGVTFDEVVKYFKVLRKKFSDFFILKRRKASGNIRDSVHTWKSTGRLLLVLREKS